MYNSMSMYKTPFPLVITMEMHRGVSKFWLVPELEKWLTSPFLVLLLHDMNVNTAAVSISNQICPFIVKL